MPQILARRLQTRYRWESDASIIEALEIQNVYDPQATGFADLNGAQPVAVVKSRLTLERRSPTTAERAATSREELEDAERQVATKKEEVKSFDLRGRAHVTHSRP